MIASRENARFMMHGNYKLEKQEGLKKKKMRSFFESFFFSLLLSRSEKSNNKGLI